MPPKSKKRKAAAASGTAQPAGVVFVLLSDSRHSDHSDIKCIGCFGKWADLVTEVKATMEKDPVELFEEFESADEVSKTIHQKNLKKAWAYGHGVEVARIDDDDYNYSYSLSVHRTSLQ